MKKFTRRLVSLVLAVFILLLSAFPVYADDSESVNDTIYNCFVGSDTYNYRQFIDLLSNNPTFKPDDTIIFCYNQYIKMFALSKSRVYVDGSLKCYSVNHTNGSITPYASIVYNGGSFSFISDESQLDYSGQSYQLNDILTLDLSYLYDSSSFTPVKRRNCTLRRDQNDSFSCCDDYGIFFTSSNFVYLPEFYFTPGYDPILTPILSYPYHVDDGFLAWLISENKLTDIPIDIAENKLSILIDFFESYGGNSAGFVAHFPQLLTRLALSNVPLTTYKEVFNSLHRLYKEYLIWCSDSVGKHLVDRSEDIPEVDIVTSEDDLTLVTDSDEDTLHDRFMREIIRVLLSIYLSLCDGFNFIGQKIDELQSTFSVGNDISVLEYLFIPTFSGFDELEEEVKAKFPIIQQLDDMPDTKDFLISSEKDLSSPAAAAAYVPPDDQPFLPAFDGNEDTVYNNDELFAFKIPEDSDILDGAFNGVSFSLVSFSRLIPAIDIFKGIISVLSVAAFTKWLLQFAPKIMYGYGSGD